MSVDQLQNSDNLLLVVDQRNDELGACMIIVELIVLFRAVPVELLIVIDICYILCGLGPGNLCADRSGIQLYRRQVDRLAVTAAAEIL